MEGVPVRFRCLLVATLAAVALIGAPVALTQEKIDSIDATVKRFLDQHRYSWRDMNVPDADGQALYDLIVKNGCKRALEIGTSTGHSGIYIAWALSKTGGRLITIDIDEGRHREAVGHFKEAGVAAFIDARLADAHDLVPKLDGPFDFVFIDADKEWYTNYAKAVLPKLTVGGLLTAHNVSQWGGRRQQTGDYSGWVRSQPNLETNFSAGVMVSRKTK
jgi:predicted O-methyltransferase YrrM